MLPSLAQKEFYGLKCYKYVLQVVKLSFNVLIKIFFYVYATCNKNDSSMLFYPQIFSPEAMTLDPYDFFF